MMLAARSWNWMFISQMTIRAIRFLVKYILCFQNKCFVSRIEASFLESKFGFWKWSFVSEFEALFPKSKLFPEIEASSL